jgi:hypothetical protein
MEAVMFHNIVQVRIIDRLSLAYINETTRKVEEEAAMFYVVVQ